MPGSSSSAGRPRVVVADRSGAPGPWLEDALSVLRGGGLVAVPTETVYGLAARAFDEVALARVFRAKGRPTTHPLIAHVLGASEARALAAHWSPAAEALSRAFFPGPVTLVVPKAEHVPLALTGGAATVAVRSPAHPVMRSLLAALGEPLAAPSANRYQTLSPTAAAHVVRSLGDAVDLVLDAGPTEHGIESTVVDLSGPAPRLLRPGAMAPASLRAVVPDLVLADEGLVVEAGARPSPGLDARHYAPRAALSVVPPASLAGAVAEAVRAGRRVAVVRRPGPVVLSGVLAEAVLPNDAAGFAAGLFAALFAADEAGADRVFVEAPPDGDAWLAVRDRLRRAQA